MEANIDDIDIKYIISLNDTKAHIVSNDEKYINDCFNKKSIDFDDNKIFNSSNLLLHNLYMNTSDIINYLSDSHNENLINSIDEYYIIIVINNLRNILTQNIKKLSPFHVNNLSRDIMENNIEFTLLNNIYYTYNIYKLEGVISDYNSITIPLKTLISFYKNNEPLVITLLDKHDNIGSLLLKLI